MLVPTSNARPDLPYTLRHNAEWVRETSGDLPWGTVCAARSSKKKASGNPENALEHPPARQHNEDAVSHH